jgi:hypothetical protein
LTAGETVVDVEHAHCILPRVCWGGEGGRDDGACHDSGEKHARPRIRQAAGGHIDRPFFVPLSSQDTLASDPEEVVKARDYGALILPAGLADGAGGPGAAFTPDFMCRFLAFMSRRLESARAVGGALAEAAEAVFEAAP